MHQLVTTTTRVCRMMVIRLMRNILCHERSMRFDGLRQVGSLLPFFSASLFPPSRCSRTSIVLACGATQRAQFARKTLDYFRERAHFHDFLALYQAHCRGRPRLLAGALPAHVIIVFFSVD
jgi:hypothetical protein